jgi:hypothetical protein
MSAQRRGCTKEVRFSTKDAAASPDKRFTIEVASLSPQLSASLDGAEKVSFQGIPNSILPLGGEAPGPIMNWMVFFSGRSDQKGGYQERTQAQATGAGGLRHTVFAVSPAINVSTMFDQHFLGFSLSVPRAVSPHFLYNGVQQDNLTIGNYRETVANDTAELHAQRVDAWFIIPDNLLAQVQAFAR